jgi:hypothetical protein
VPAPGDRAKRKEGSVVQMRTRRFGLTAAIGVLALPATAAAAPTLDVDRSCYTPDQAINLTGSGYSPGAQVTVVASLLSSFGNQYGAFDPITSGADGSISEKLRAPELASDRDTEETMALAGEDPLADQNLPEEDRFGAAAFKLSIFDFFVDAWDSRKVDPRKTTTFTAYGFEGLGPVVYAHYVLGGKLKKTVRIGALSGDCGNLSKTMKQFPFRPVPAGDWRVDFDTSQRYVQHAGGIRFPHVKVSAKKAVR